MAYTELIVVPVTGLEPVCFGVADASGCEPLASTISATQATTAEPGPPKGGRAFAARSRGLEN